ELDQAAIVVGVFREVIAVYVAIARKGQTGDGFFQRDRFGVDELRVQPRGGQAVGLGGLEERPRAYVLIAVLHAVFAIRAIGRRRHAPFGGAVLVDDRQAFFGHVGGKGRVPKDLLRDVPLRRHRTRFRERHAHGLRRRVFFHPVDVFGQRVDRCRAV